MGIRDVMLFALDKTRAINGPAVMDLRPTSVTILTRTWSGGAKGSGYPVDSPVLHLPPHTKVRHVTPQEIESSGGQFEEGDVNIEDITPRYTAPDGSLGGFTEAELFPTVGQGQHVIYRLMLQSGATGIAGDYGYVDLRRDHTYHFELTVRRQHTTA